VDGLSRDNEVLRRAARAATRPRRGPSSRPTLEYRRYAQRASSSSRRCGATARDRGPPRGLASARVLAHELAVDSDGLVALAGREQLLGRSRELGRRRRERSAGIDVARLGVGSSSKCSTLICERSPSAAIHAAMPVCSRTAASPSTNSIVRRPRSPRATVPATQSRARARAPRRLRLGGCRRARRLTRHREPRRMRSNADARRSRAPASLARRGPGRDRGARSLAPLLAVVARRHQRPQEPHGDHRRGDCHTRADQQAAPGLPRRLCSSSPAATASAVTQVPTIDCSRAASTSAASPKVSRSADVRAGSWSISTECRPPRECQKAERFAQHVFSSPSAIETVLIGILALRWPPARHASMTAPQRPRAAWSRAWPWPGTAARVLASLEVLIGCARTWLGQLRGSMLAPRRR